MTKIINWLPKKIPKSIQGEMRETARDSKTIEQKPSWLIIKTINQIFKIFHKNNNKYFKKPYSVLEVGCFQMYGLKPFLENQYLSTGVDIVEHALKVNKFIDIHDSKLTRIIGMMENLKFKKTSFNSIFIHSALHHSYDVNKVCKDMYKFLKMNGIFIIANEPYKSLLDRKNKRMENFIEQGHNDHWYEIKDYLIALKKANFKKISIIPPDYFFDMKPLLKHEVKIWKSYASEMITPFLKTKIGASIFKLLYPLIYKLITIPLLIVAKKE